MIQLQVSILCFIVIVIVLAFLLDYDFEHNQKAYTILIFIFSQVYNFILGFHTYFIFMLSLFAPMFLARFFNEVWNSVYILTAIMFVLIISLLLVPVNYFVKKKVKISLFFYILASVLAFSLGVLTFVLMSKLGYM